jgi:hypothetical protein
MKFNLKKLFGFALVILLIWSVYNMFFSKTIEGLDLQCYKHHNNKTTCENTGCYYQVKKEHGTTMTRCLNKQCGFYGSPNAYTTDLLNKCSQQKLGPGGTNCKPSKKARTGGFLCQSS